MHRNGTMIRKAWLSLALGAAGIGVAAGCVNEQPPPGLAVDTVPHEMYPKVIGTGGLNQWLKVSAANVDSDRVLKVSVAVRSVAQRGINTQYRFLFLDAEGLPLDPDPAWKRQRISGGAQAFYVGNSTNDRATDWRLEIRPNQD